MKLISLTKGRVAVVDDEDYERLSVFKWYFEERPGRKTGYAGRGQRIGTKVVQYRMHREILDVPKGLQVDHRNGDGLDNRRQNLRLATHGQNVSNSPGRPERRASRFKGVFPSGPNWRVQIVAQGKRYRLGSFCNADLAAAVYDHAALALHGEFAYLNRRT